MYPIVYPYLPKKNLSHHLLMVGIPLISSMV
nr:MAG TPA: hypothetical protein [Caudoviricetes sp.]